MAFAGLTPDSSETAEGVGLPLRRMTETMAGADLELSLEWMVASSLGCALSIETPDELENHKPRGNMVAATLCFHGARGRFTASQYMARDILRFLHRVVLSVLYA